jgi:hypothetical protein
LVLALVDRGKGVSFGEAWCTLQVSGIRTYSASFMNVNEGCKSN